MDKTKICLYIYWGERSEPHTCGVNEKLSVYWGERSEPHTCGENGKLSICIYICIYIYMYLYMFGTCVFRIYIHPALFVRDAIFPHCLQPLALHVAQETRLAEQKR